MCVWCLVGGLQCQFFGDWIQIGYCVIGFYWCWVYLWVDDFLLDNDVGFGEYCFGCCCVVGFLVEDVIVVFFFQIGVDDWC